MTLVPAVSGDTVAVVSLDETEVRTEVVVVVIRVSVVFDVGLVLAFVCLEVFFGGCRVVRCHVVGLYVLPMCAIDLCWDVLDRTVCIDDD